MMEGGKEGLYGGRKEGRTIWWKEGRKEARPLFVQFERPVGRRMKTKGALGQCFFAVREGYSGRLWRMITTRVIAEGYSERL
jgi:hypothetical protein